MNPLTLILIGYVVMSVVTFTAYCLDKRAAIRGMWRMREKDLHVLALLGGFPGAIVGQHIFKHKRNKRSFMFVLGLIVIAHVAAWGIAASV